MSLSVSIQQFSGGVTEVPPTTELIKTSNYLWELMGKYGIQAMRYTGGGGVVVGPGGAGTTGTGKIPYKDAFTVSGLSGSDQGYTFQNDSLINAVDLDDFLLNGAPVQKNLNNAFTFDAGTGTINYYPNKFYGGDKLTIPYAKYVNITGSVSSTLNTTIYFTNVATYDLAWTPALIAKYGSGADFSVEMLGDDGIYRVTIVSITPNNISNTTSYHFDFGGNQTGRIIF